MKILVSGTVRAQLVRKSARVCAIEVAHPIARAGPSKVARPPSERCEAAGSRMFVASQLGEHRAEAYAAVMPTGVHYSLNSSRAVKAVSGKSEKTPSTPSP